MREYHRDADRASQQAQWLLWQMGQVAVEGPKILHPPESPQELAMPDISRSRYAAVISRMKQAGQRTGVYTSWA